MTTTQHVSAPTNFSYVDEDFWSVEAQIETLLAEVPVDGEYSARPRPRIYVDTSVIGGYYDGKSRDACQHLFEMFRRGDLTLVISDVVVRSSGTRRHEYGTCYAPFPMSISNSWEIARWRKP